MLIRIQSSGFDACPAHLPCICLLMLIIAFPAFGVTISGQVDTSTNGVPRARITLFTTDLRYFEEERTDDSGHFEFQYVAAGSYNLGVAALGFDYQVRTLIVSNQAMDAAFNLLPEIHPGRWWSNGAESPASSTLLPSGELLICRETQAAALSDYVNQMFSGTPSLALTPHGRHVVTLNTDGGAFLLGAAPGTNSDDPLTPVARTYWRNTNAWVAAPNAITPRAFPGLVRLPDERLLIMGGELDSSGSRLTNSCEIYDPRLNVWTQTAPFQIPAALPPAVVLYTGEVLKTWPIPELYNVSMRLWRPAASMLQQRSGASTGDYCDHEIVHLEDGRVMAIGILPAVTNANTRFVEFYDPSNNIWSLGPNPRALRNRPKTIMLMDGRVLAFGGQYSGPEPPPVEVGAAGTVQNCTRIADLYDPRSNTWRSVADLSRFIFNHLSSVSMVLDGSIVTTSLTSTINKNGVFQPPYLFRGVRPRIDELSTTDFVHGSNFAMRVSMTDAITKIALIGARASQRWMDGGPQRYLALPFTQNGSEVTATIPVDPALAVPGWYILTVLVDDIPSVGRMVRVTSAPPPPQELPVVTVNVVNATAAEGGAFAELQFRRTGPTTTALVAPFTIGGSAINPTDYDSISNHVYFPVFESTARVVMGPRDDTLSEGTENATIALRSMAHFVGNTNIATTILDNDPLPPPLTLKVVDRRNGEYAITVRGPASRMLELQGSQDLLIWRRLGNISTSAGTNQIAELIRPSERYLFFRVREN